MYTVDDMEELYCTMINLDDLVQRGIIQDVIFTLKLNNSNSSNCSFTVLKPDIYHSIVQSRLSTNH